MYLIYKEVNMAEFVNAAPRFISRGTEDKSTRTVLPDAIPLPYHMPLCYIQAAKGPTTREVLSSARLPALYGSETFDKTKKYYNHQTQLLEIVAGTGNTCMVQRLVPDDAKTSNATLYLDVLKTKGPEYARNSQGDYVYEDDGVTFKKKGTTSTTTEEKFVFQGTEAQDATNDIEVAYLILTTNTAYLGEVTNQEGLHLTPSKVVRTDVDPVANDVKANDAVKANDDAPAFKTKLDKAVDDIVTGAATSGTSVDVKDANALNNLKSTDTNMITTISLSQALSTVKYLVAKLNKLFTTKKTVTVTKVTPNMVDIYSIKWIVEYDENHSGKLGLKETKQGYQEDSSTHEKSTMYPILELLAANPGEAYDNVGMKFISPDTDKLDTRVVTELKTLPYGLSLVTRLSKKDSPTIFRSLYGENDVDFVFKDLAINPTTEAAMDFNTIFAENWFNTDDRTKPLVYNDYKGAKLYTNNLDTLLKRFLELEKPYISTELKTWDDGFTATTLSWFDFTTAEPAELDEEYGLINPFTARSTANKRYFSLRLSDAELVGTPVRAAEVNMSSSTPFFLNGGSDGTLSNENYERGIIKKMAEYLDPNSEVQDLAINCESSIYDTGFSLDTKKELTSFIGLRKDTMLVLSTHVHGKEFSITDHRAIGVALKTRLNLVPESEYYGTPVCRGLVVMGDGRMSDGSVKYRVAGTLEVAYKSARMMGAGSGKWNDTYLFDKAPNNILSMLVDYHPSFIPEGIKPTLWEDGLVWAQPFDRSSYHFPAMQTVYKDDTSVLNSYFTAMAITVMTKIAAESWRNFTGSQALTDGQFIDAVTAFLDAKTTGVFANLFTIIWVVEITGKDEQRGYSYRLRGQIYANNMKTVCVFNPEAYRMSDLNGNR